MLIKLSQYILIHARRFVNAKSGMVKKVNACYYETNLILGGALLLHNLAQTARIKRPDYLRMNDGGVTVYGCDQEWYTYRWQVMAGCGPTTGATMLLYQSAQHPDWRLPYRYGTKRQALSAMQDTWQYIKPGIKGVNTTAKFSGGLNRLCDNYSLPGSIHTLDIPSNVSHRPDIQEVTAFIYEALTNDCPVAFLNLNRGNEPQLENWHWVLLYGLHMDVTGEYTGEIMDQCTLRTFSLNNWLSRTTLGGGFVYLAAGRCPQPIRIECSG